MPWRVGALGASLQYRLTSCLCLWVELYEPERNLAILRRGQNWQACSPGQTPTPGEGETLVLLGQPQPRGVCEEGRGLFW